MELTINGKKAIDVFEGDLYSFVKFSMNQAIALSTMTNMNFCVRTCVPR